jgi:hypothetical protein
MLIPCPTVVEASEDEKRYDPGYAESFRLSFLKGWGTATAPTLSEEVSKDPKNPKALKISENGTLSFELDQTTKSSDSFSELVKNHASDLARNSFGSNLLPQGGDPPIQWLPFDNGEQIRLAVIPEDNSSPVRFIDATVDLLHVPEGFNVVFKDTKLKFGDHCEIYLSRKTDYSKTDGKWVYVKSSDYTESGGSLDPASFRNFYLDPDIYFLGTFRIVKDMDVEARPVGELRPEKVDSLSP